jgi:hypothetical protein
MDEFWENESTESEQTIPELEATNGFEINYPSREDLYRQYEISRISRFMVRFSSNLRTLPILIFGDGHF